MVYERHGMSHFTQQNLYDHFKTGGLYCRWIVEHFENTGGLHAAYVKLGDIRGALQFIQDNDLDFIMNHRQRDMFDAHLTLFERIDLDDTVNGLDTSTANNFPIPLDDMLGLWKEQQVAGFTLAGESGIVVAKDKEKLKAFLASGLVEVI